MDFKSTIKGCFGADHWLMFAQQFGHHFFDTHWTRQIVYDIEFIQGMKDKTVLEVGGFPGLETANLMFRGAKVTVLDSPDYIPDYYQAFVSRYGLRQIVWDIVQGAPPIEDTWDCAIVSDVLMHINGFPDKFLEWLFAHCKMVILINYLSGYEEILPAKEHTLHTSFAYLGQDALTKYFTGKGYELIEGRHIENRVALFFKGGVK